MSILLHRPRLIKPPDSQGDQTRPPASCWLKLAFKLPSLNFLSLSLPAASCPVTIYLLDLSLGALLLSLPLSFHQPMNFCFPPFPLVALSLSLASPTPTFSSPQHLSCSVLCSTRFKIYGPQTPSLTWTLSPGRSYSVSEGTKKKSSGVSGLGRRGARCQRVGFPSPRGQG